MFLQLIHLKNTWMCRKFNSETYDRFVRTKTNKLLAKKFAMLNFFFFFIKKLRRSINTFIFTILLIFRSDIHIFSP